MKRHFAMMATYNRWANVRLYDMAAVLPDELYRKPIGVYFKSLHGTLNHLLTADRIWMRRLEGKGDHPDQLNATIHDDLVSLRAARVVEDQRIIDFVDSLDEADFEKSWELHDVERRAAAAVRARNPCTLVQSPYTSSRSSTCSSNCARSQRT